MPENDHLSGCLDEINLEFVEREETPRLFDYTTDFLYIAI